MKVALCCIGRLENQYAVEFVEWYKKLGFDNIIIYDNNHEGEEYFEDVLRGYIDDGFVKIIPFRNIENAQMWVYFDFFYKCHKTKEYDWIAFFDFDEFLVLKNHSDIKEYIEWINKSKKVDCIKINWMLFGDNDIVKNDGRPVNERFIKPIDYDKKTTFIFPQNFHVKSIIRCDVNSFKIGWSPHVPIETKNIYNADGELSDVFPFNPYVYNNAYLKHFYTKTIDEYIHNKMIRGVGDRTIERFLNDYGPLKDFFKINDLTDEKVKFLKENNYM